MTQTRPGREVRLRTSSLVRPSSAPDRQPPGPAVDGDDHPISGPLAAIGLGDGVGIDEPGVAGLFNEIEGWTTDDAQPTFISPISDQPVASIVWLMIRGVDASAWGFRRWNFLEMLAGDVLFAGVTVTESFHQNVFRRILQAARPVEPHVARLVAGASGEIGDQVGEALGYSGLVLNLTTMNIMLGLLKG